MILTLSEREVNVIKNWAEKSIHGGHWGDGDLLVPEEEIILEKLNRIGKGRMNFTEIEANIILVWSESSLGIHTMEEESVINKLKSIISV